MSFPSIEDQLKVIKRGAVEIVPEDELKQKIEKSIKENKPLRVKLGCDPTRPDLHLGHSVILRKLRQFQDLGHEAILIIGDFTASIGDPSGQNKTRPALTSEEIKENARTYYHQAVKVLDADRTTIRYNNDWLGSMKFQDVIKLASKLTVARMIERDDFSKRFEANQPISLHEFLYPLAQGQDSVELKSDIELGGTDQKFNLLVGRQLQKEAQQSPQICLMMPLLIGTDGSMKMSKSSDNYIGIDEAPEEMYGKILSIPDDLMYSYFELLTDVSVDELSSYKEKIHKDPRNTKHELAYIITALYHDGKLAAAAQKHFEQTVVKGDIPDDIEEATYPAGSSQRLLDIIGDLGFTSSNGETKRLIKQGGVTLDDKKVTQKNHAIDFKEDTEFILKVGKRNYARIVSE